MPSWSPSVHLHTHLFCHYNSCVFTQRKFSLHNQKSFYELGHAFSILPLHNILVIVSSLTTTLVLAIVDELHTDGISRFLDATCWSLRTAEQPCTSSDLMQRLLQTWTRWIENGNRPQTKNGTPILNPLLLTR